MNIEPLDSLTRNSPAPEQLAGVTRRYARFSTSAAGLASVIGGGIALLVYLIGGLAPPQALTWRLMIASAPFLWIAIKEVMQRTYYQPFGRVRELRSVETRRWHLGLTLFTAAVSAGVAAFILWPIFFGGQAMIGGATWGYLALVMAMPFLVWFFMKTPLEFVVGVFLISQAALMVRGASYSLGEQPQAPIAAVLLMIVGVRQHLEFRRLRGELNRGVARS